MGMKCDELQRHSIRGAMYNGEEIYFCPKCGRKLMEDK
jgi:predicted  nucleic acid-binding Zn-ribbon protein